MSALPSIGPSPDIPAMAARIRAEWQSAVGSILVTGRLLHQVRTGLNKQQWRALLSLLPFTIRWVQMLIAIGASLPENLQSSECVRPLSAGAIHPQGIDI